MRRVSRGVSGPLPAILCLEMPQSPKVCSTKEPDFSPEVTAYITGHFWLRPLVTSVILVGSLLSKGPTTESGARQGECVNKPVTTCLLLTSPTAK